MNKNPLCFKNKSVLAKPKNVRTEGLCALVRASLRVTKSFGWIFGPPFLWFISFGGAKEMNIL
jgi:hypothetical protein